jgi:3',5'-cyclic-nucleotide phosphodiesterase
MSQNLTRLAPHLAIRLSGETPIPVHGPAITCVELSFLGALRQFAHNMSSQIDWQDVVTSVMKCTQELIAAERSSVFLLTQKNNSLTTIFQSELKKSITIPRTSGIAGEVFVSGKVVVTENVRDLVSFEKSVDAETGYATRSLLAVPLFDLHGSVIGCTEFLNKQREISFTDADVAVVRIVNMIVALAIENSNIARANTQAIGALKSMADTGSAVLAKGGDAIVATKIVRNARSTMGAQRAILDVAEDDQLRQLAADGFPFLEEIPFDVGFVGQAIVVRKPLVDNACATATIDGRDGPSTSSAITFPVFTGRGLLFSAFVCVSSKPNFFMPRDIDVLSPFVAFCSFSLQNRDVAIALEKVSPGPQLSKCITEDESVGYTIPRALTLSEGEAAVVSSRHYFSLDSKGITHFKQLFLYFQKLRFFELFQITAERFFTFLSLVSNRYLDLPYHNWAHACDVAQFVYFMIMHGDLIGRYQPWELFCLMTAAICHDINHGGLDSAYHAQMQTPLGSLYKDQSVMEIHHVHEAITIITRRDVNLFGHEAGQICVRDPSRARVWALFIRLILGTDMRQHSEIVREAQAIVNAGKFDWREQDMRSLGLTLLLKAANVSNVARPFETVDAWFTLLSEELFHQGDLEREAGIPFTSDILDRRRSVKAIAEIEFYKVACSPMFVVIGKLFPPLLGLADTVRENLERWKLYHL